ncbi:MAG: hypothetical protein K9W44_08880 [Candidatus Lokiarchaeota archaeon]|nr:hypothetical protein [Candidatus Harpocratesius repetitus]
MTVIIAWELILRLWEKLRYYGSMEFWISLILILFRFRSRSSLDITPKLYYYRNLVPIKDVKENPENDSLIIFNN